jgi:hypothetical protein
MNMLPRGSAWLVISRAYWASFEAYIQKHVHAADFWSAGLQEKPVTMAEIQALQHFAGHTPVGESKVALVGSADQMRPEAANALLKLLEEPPHYLSIVVLTESEYLLPTVRSRVQRIHPDILAELGAESQEATSFEQWQAVLHRYNCQYEADREQAREILMYQRLLHSTIQQPVVLEGFSKP